MSHHNHVRITAYPRLHFGLHDCGNATNRLFGGIGAAIKGPPTIVEATFSKTTSYSVSFTAADMSDRTVEAVNNLIERLQLASDGHYAITVVSSAPEHMGLGSKTSLLLAIVEAVAAIDDTLMKYDRDSLVRLTQRGGTSGVGVNTFRLGGLIADGGHRSHIERNFAPSSARKPDDIAPVIARVALPDEWRVALFYDPLHQSIEGQTEKAYFKKIMPLPEIDNLCALAATYHGILPAVIDKDLDQLAVAFKDMNNTGMKRHELNLQTDSSKQFLSAIWGHGYAAGVSSFGPAIFVIHHRDSPNIAITREIAHQSGLTELGIYEFDNSGVECHGK